VTAFFGAAIGFHLYRGLKILSYADVEVAVKNAVLQLRKSGINWTLSAQSCSR